MAWLGLGYREFCAAQASGGLSGSRSERRGGGRRVLLAALAPGHRSRKPICAILGSWAGENLRVPACDIGLSPRLINHEQYYVLTDLYTLLLRGRKK